MPKSGEQSNYQGPEGPIERRPGDIDSIIAHAQESEEAEEEIPETKSHFSCGTRVNVLRNKKEGAEKRKLEFDWVTTDEQDPQPGHEEQIVVAKQDLKKSIHPRHLRRYQNVDLDPATYYFDSRELEREIKIMEEVIQGLTEQAILGEEKIKERDRKLAPLKARKLLLQGILEQLG